MFRKTFQSWVEKHEYEAIMIHKAKTGETLKEQIRKAIKQYVNKLKKNG